MGNPKGMQGPFKSAKRSGFGACPLGGPWGPFGGRLVASWGSAWVLLGFFWGPSGAVFSSLVEFLADSVASLLDRLLAHFFLMHHAGRNFRHTKEEIRDLDAVMNICASKIMGDKGIPHSWHRR